MRAIRYLAVILSLLGTLGLTTISAAAETTTPGTTPKPVSVTKPSPAQNITVYSAGDVPVGQTRQLTAYVPLSPNTVTWSVNGILGGNATVGTVTDSGLYMAPLTPTAAPVSVAATSAAYADKSNAVAINITQLPVQLWSISPAAGAAGAFKFSLNGANFNANSAITIEGVSVTSSFVSPTSMRASGTIPASLAGKKISVKVVNPGLGGTTSSSVTYSVTTATPTTGTGDAPKPTPEPTPTPTPTPVPTATTVSFSPSAAALSPLGSRQFTASVTGGTNLSVIFSVNGINGGNANIGTITGAGLYTVPASMPAQTVTIRATSVATPTAFAEATITISPPNAGNGLGTANLSAGRFLEQATFGPTPTAIAKVKQMGIDAWLDEQFALAETAITDPGGMNSSALKSQFLNRVSTADDQLRQRVAYALSQIIVISMNKNIYPDEIVPYLQILSRNAFGNYRTLLGEISTSAQMGKYLDIANSNKPTAGGGANENYPREMMQLFTIGLVQLNADGSTQMDANKKAVPTYDQTTVQQIALALTGWTYAGPNANNWENFSGPMQPRDTNHDTRAKSFLGCNLPAGQTTVADLNATLDCVFAHPNVAPFISTRLIRSLVTSNPSSAYIGRVAAVFNDNGAGVKGDLKATVRAILTDPEARDDTAPPTAGRLRDPTLHLTTLLRALNGSITAGNQLPWQMSQISQEPLTPPSVFGFYSPLYRIPHTNTVGPEFQIYSPTEAVLRGNLFWQAITSPGSDFTLDLSPFTSAATTVELIDRVDQTLLYGRMPQAMRQTLANILAQQDSAATRAQLALYLTALSGFHAVQY